ncbi:MAPEG family protein [Serratia rubidaea]|uniref:Inner membrane protein yecN n=1 Tax=Serratia rubidaea TaxID=61652 RepID=A0A448SPF0_SERRU|nr:MAPEG family protein [Serratia rubidaea]MBH1929021.1 MAPEG family protein [Serratia rubidaea]MDC6118852.1 MAPEG family protein [Serratia rubidaea]MEB7588211.1 MAPEG family protein [Serratia rubidaea]VEI69540.1 Inner membrane protein yecN [Serratia rubidaea]
MVSALYVVLGALLLIKLSYDVVKLRMQYRVAYGDGGFYELQTAIRVHGNAVEYIPIAAILLVLMEMNGAEVWLIHLSGLLLIAGRLVHFYGLRNREARWRASGMIATYLSLVLMVLANTYYLPWELIFTLH